MRLDKYLAETAQCTRSEAKTMLAKGRVQVNGAVCKKGDTQLKETDTVAAIRSSSPSCSISPRGW